MPVLALCAPGLNNKYMLVIDSDVESKKMFALQSAEGPVTEFLVRYYRLNPDHRAVP